MPFSTYYPPGLVGCYPATLTAEQIHTGNRNKVERSSRRPGNVASRAWPGETGAPSLLNPLKLDPNMINMPY